MGTEPETRSHTMDQILMFGAIIHKCWDGQYRSFTELGEDILAGMDQEDSKFCQPMKTQGSLMSIDQFERRVAECRDYLTLSGVSTATTSAN